MFIVFTLHTFFFISSHVQDVTYDPVFSNLVTCDAVGNVCLTIPKEEFLLTSNWDKASSFMLSKTIQMVTELHLMSNKIESN